MEGYRYVRSGTKDVVAAQINRKTAVSSTLLKSSLASDHTLQASIDEEGVIPRAIRELFAQVEKKRGE